MNIECHAEVFTEIALAPTSVPTALDTALKHAYWNQPEITTAARAELATLRAQAESATALLAALKVAESIICPPTRRKCGPCNNSCKFRQFSPAGCQLAAAIARAK